jgi:hypothetical protein
VTVERIPPARWAEFLAAFSRAHAGWLASLERRPARQAPRLLMRDLPLLAVTSDLDRVIVGFSNAAAHADHVIERPIAIWQVHTASGAERGLEIDTADGERVRLRFRSAVAAELVNGA